MKDDAPAPDKIPQKRRQMETADARWLQEWLHKPDLTFRERKRILAEQARRKQARRQVKLVVVAGEEGTTPPQVRKAHELLPLINPTEVAFVGRVAKIAHLFPSDLDIQADYYPIYEVRNVVREATVVMAFPKDGRLSKRGELIKPEHVEGVWDAVRYAKHRNLPVRVILPDGTEGS